MQNSTHDWLDASVERRMAARRVAAMPRATVGPRLWRGAFHGLLLSLPLWATILGALWLFMAAGR